jgi:hypothetical protein
MMLTRNSAINVFIILVFVAAFPSPVLSDSVRIYGGSFNLPIPAPDDPDSEYGRGWMDDAVIEIPDHFTVYDIDVRISVTHTKVFDLQIFLQSPAGRRLCLNMYNPFDEYFDGENYFQTIFDDEAAVPIEHGAPPFTGRFQPKGSNRLNVFDGLDTFGSWHLQIYDAYYYSTGNLDSFELIITIPEPASVLLLTLGAGLLVLSKPRRNRKI